MPDNGLISFSLHRADEAQRAILATIDEDLRRSDDARAITFEPEVLDPETVARRYLNEMIASPAVPALTVDEREPTTEYRIIGTETVALTKTKVVKFAQYRNRIPVYGSLVTVELDGDNSFLAINSAVGDPEGVDPVATVSPARAVDIIKDDAGGDSVPVATPPRLYFYYDGAAYRWRLVYIATDVPRQSSAPGPLPAIPELVDYVIDAHTGELVARLARTQSVTWTPDEIDATDGLGIVRHVRVELGDNGNRRLNDTVRNVQTFDFDFKDVVRPENVLPGRFVTNPPDPWNVAGISAHANAAEVADFLLNTLRRNGLDDRGGPFISSINCTYKNPDPANKVWKNAAWVGTQMIYGQRMVSGSLRSYCIARDVVAHEITHGLTSATARLQYETESGALNESYSDIFGIIISNLHVHEIDDWDWEMGEDLDATGVPLRDMSDPTKQGQAAHMNDFKRLPPGEMPDKSNDHGYVHHNSGIHNKAAYNLLTAKTSTGAAMFTMQEAASLFYLTLAHQLSRTSLFADSRRGIELAARTLFRNETPASQVAKLAAIGKAFNDVGVTA
jgi:bacillolysin/neutral peptidase B